MAFWYPFRSREVKDITSHLTPEEHSSLNAIATQNGTWFGGWIVGPGAILSVFLSDASFESFSHFSAIAISTVIFGAFFVISGIIARPMNKRMKTFLCGTEYAKRTGYSVDLLSMYGFGW